MRAQLGLQRTVTRDDHRHPEQLADLHHGVEALVGDEARDTEHEVGRQRVEHAPVGIRQLLAPLRRFGSTRRRRAGGSRSAGRSHDRSTRSATNRLFAAMRWPPARLRRSIARSGGTGQAGGEVVAARDRARAPTGIAPACARRRTSARRAHSTSTWWAKACELTSAQSWLRCGDAPGGRHERQGEGLVTAQRECGRARSRARSVGVALRGVVPEAQQVGIREQSREPVEHPLGAAGLLDPLADDQPRHVMRPFSARRRARSAAAS